MEYELKNRLNEKLITKRFKITVSIGITAIFLILTVMSVAIKVDEKTTKTVLAYLIKSKKKPTNEYAYLLSLRPSRKIGSNFCEPLKSGMIRAEQPFDEINGQYRFNFEEVSYSENSCHYILRFYSENPENVAADKLKVTIIKKEKIKTLIQSIISAR